MQYPFNEGDTYYTFDEKNRLIKSCWDDQSEVLYSEDKKYFVAEPLTDELDEKLYGLDEEDVCDIPERVISDDYCEWGEVIKIGGHTLLLCIYVEHRQRGERHPIERTYSILTPR